MTTDNETGIATGWLPGQLSPAGREIARQLGKRRAHDDLAVVFVSDLRRAVETAELAFPASAMPIYQDPRLREASYGALNGAPVERVAAERARHIDTPFPGGQSYRDVVEAMRSFLGDLTAGWDGRTVLVISHSANKWALDYLLHRARLEALVDAPFNWQEGWTYHLPSGWAGGNPATPAWI